MGTRTLIILLPGHQKMLGRKTESREMYKENCSAFKRKGVSILILSEYLLFERQYAFLYFKCKYLNN